jgi:hypothetical protein
MRGEPEANIVVASEAEAAQGASSAPADGMMGAELYGICAESIAALQYALLGANFESDDIDLNILATHPNVFVYTQMHGGWLFRFPHEVIEMLAAIRAGERKRLSQAWAKIFEHNGEPPSLQEVDEILDMIVRLARRARKENKPCTGDRNLVSRGHRMAPQMPQQAPPQRCTVRLPRALAELSARRRV